MSKLRNGKYDETDLLDIKVEQLEKRIENMEKILYAAPRNESNNNELIQLISTLLSSRQSKEESDQQREDINTNERNVNYKAVNGKKEKGEGYRDIPQEISTRRLSTII